MRGSIELPYGKSKVDLVMPDGIEWDFLEPREITATEADEIGIVKSALHNPVGSLPLAELARGKKNVIILVSDISRPCPSKKMLQPLLGELHAAGVKKEQITIIFGLGLHRRHTQEEQIRLVGEDIFNNYRCIDHDVSDCEYLGHTSRQTPIYVFRALIGADLVIGTGNLEYHYSAGYSGGMKAAMPGVCGEETIRANHRLMFNPLAVVGRVDGNPMREEIEEIGCIIGVKFIVNVVLDSNKQIWKAVAGDPIKAHRIGCQYIDNIYKRQIKHKYDVVIASAGGFPKDINIYQAHKGMDNASFAVKDGGAIVLLAEAKEGFGNEVFKDYMMKAASPEEVLQRIHKRFEIGGHKAAKICQILKRARIYLYSSLDPGMTRVLFMRPVKSIAEALETERSIKGKSLNCLVIPYAGSILPSLEE